jgi:hypothetical protein
LSQFLPQRKLFSHRNDFDQALTLATNQGIPSGRNSDVGFEAANPKDPNRDSIRV